MLVQTKAWSEVRGSAPVRLLFLCAVPLFVVNFYIVHLGPLRTRRKRMLSDLKSWISYWLDTSNDQNTGPTTTSRFLNDVIECKMAF